MLCIVLSRAGYVDAALLFYQGHFLHGTPCLFMGHIYGRLFFRYGVPVASLCRQVITCAERLYSNMQDMAMVR